MTTLKVIKATAFDTNGTKGTTYTCAKSGRVLNVSTLSFSDEAADALKYDDKTKTLVISCKVETIVTEYHDGITLRKGLQVLPALGMDIAVI